MSAAPGAEDTACPNCGRARTGGYCAHCGQKAAPIAPTLGYLVHELTHELVHVDGKIFRSLRLLLTRPGFVTREIFAGRRASYVSPIRLYLIASILWFGFRALFGVPDSVNLEYNPDPGEVVDPVMLERTAETERTISRAMNVWLPRAMFVLVPLFAALLMLFRRSGGRTYPQHLYFALHLHAVWFFASTVGLLFRELVPFPIVAGVASLFILLYSVVYSFTAFRRVYETTIWGTLWRAVTIGAVYMTALVLAVVTIAAPTLLPFLRGLSSG
jgi:hypothetical protein